MPAIVMLALFIFFTMFDTQYRGDVDPVKGNAIGAQAVMYRTETVVEKPTETLAIPDSLSFKEDDHK